MSDKTKLAEIFAGRNLNFTSERQTIVVLTDHKERVNFLFDRDGELQSITAQAAPKKESEK